MQHAKPRVSCDQGQSQFGRPHLARSCGSINAKNLLGLKGG